MTYINLGSRQASTGKDQTGLNSGNLTSAFTPTILGLFIAQFECYHMVVTNVPGGAQGQIFIGSRPWGFTFPVQGTEWDPSQPMLLEQGQELDVLWNIASAGTTIPVVTGWFRYDPEVPGNS